MNVPPEHRSPNVVWSPSLVTRAERGAILRQHGGVVWLTGLSGAGKSTIAKSLERTMIRDGHFSYVLDGDNVRHGLNGDLGFSDADRQENIRRVSEVARLMADAGVVVIVAFISPFAVDRDKARRIAGDLAFMEVHVHADLSVCEARDPKGHYRQARKGQLKGFTGIDAPYEAPAKPDLRLDTSVTEVETSVGRIVALLKSRGVLDPYAAQEGGGI
jgi:adenylyl-sulfate kinase